MREGWQKHKDGTIHKGNMCVVKMSGDYWWATVPIPGEKYNVVRIGPFDYYYEAITAAEKENKSLNIKPRKVDNG